MTFPYILAKVRLQAKYNPETDETELTTGTAAKTIRKKERYSSAWDVLAKVYAEKGFTGWYQVSRYKAPFTCSQAEAMICRACKHTYSRLSWLKLCSLVSRTL